MEFRVLIFVFPLVNLINSSSHIFYVSFKVSFTWCTYHQIIGDNLTGRNPSTTLNFSDSNNRLLLLSSDAFFIFYFRFRCILLSFMIFHTVLLSISFFNSCCDLCQIHFGLHAATAVLKILSKTLSFIFQIIINNAHIVYSYLYISFSCMDTIAPIFQSLGTCVVLKTILSSVTSITLPLLLRFVIIPGIIWSCYGNFPHCIFEMIAYISSSIISPLSSSASCS